MSDPRLVWYVAYGSNLLTDRMMAYLVGCGDDRSVAGTVSGDGGGAADVAADVAADGAVEPAQDAGPSCDGVVCDSSADDLCG